MSIILDILFGFFGLIVLVGIAFLFSNNKRKVNWKLVIIGILLQILFAIFVLMTPWGASVFNALSEFFVTIINFTFEGAQFVFGALANQTDFGRAFPQDLQQKGFGFIFAFQVLPTIIFFSSLMAVLYHLGIMQIIVQAMAWVMAKTMNVSGAESLSVAANVFIGQTEAPLVVRPYVSGMTQSELLTLMVGGMATIAGGVLAAYVGILGGDDPVLRVFYAKQLLSASIMAAPATMVISKILIPETEESETRGSVKIRVEKTAANVIDAAATGAADGLNLALNVAAMLLAFIALIAMSDYILEGIGNITGLNALIGRPLNLTLILGYLLSPIAWVIGVPWKDAVTVGGLIGEKIVINEFVAYIELGKIIQNAGLSEKAIIISTYALCGFANFSSIAIQIGGIGGIAPDRRSDLARYGLRAVLGGSLATLMTATIAGVLISL